MSETMVERVARAIYEERGNSYAHRTFDANGKAYGKWFAALSSARAAIEAMREVPESIYAEIEQLRYDVWHTPSEAEAAKLSHEYMIDAALSEGQEGDRG